MAMYVMLVEGDTWISETIKTATNSRFSHCGFVDLGIGFHLNREMDIKLLSGLTYEADVPQVLSREVRSYPWPFTCYEIEGLTQDKEQALRAWCLNKVGTPYDLGKIIGLWFALCLNILGVRPILDHREAYHCAEFVWEGLNHVGLTLENRQELIVPGDLAFEPRLLKTQITGG